MGRWDHTVECACGRQMEEGRYVCALCRRKYRDQSKSPKVDVHKVRVVHDPTGMYPRSALLPKSEFYPAARSAYDTTIDLALWSEGMIIEDDEGEQYRVVGEQLTEQRLEREAA